MRAFLEKTFEKTTSLKFPSKNKSKDRRKQKKFFTCFTKIIGHFFRLIAY